MFKDGKEQKRPEGWMGASQKPETGLNKSDQEREILWMMCTPWVLGLGRLPTQVIERPAALGGESAGHLPIRVGIGIISMALAESH